MSAHPPKLDYSTPPPGEGRFTLARTARGGTVFLSPAPAKAALAWAGAILCGGSTAFCFFASIGETISMLGAPDPIRGFVGIGIIVLGIASFQCLRACARTLRPVVIRLDGATLYLLRPPWLTGSYRVRRRDEILGVDAAYGQLRMTLANGSEVVLLKGFRKTEYPWLAAATHLLRQWLGS